MTKERFKLPVAVFMALKKDDAYLLLRRIGTGKRDGMYSLPAGGLEQNEDILSAAIREAEEEIGVKINSLDVTLFKVIHCKLEGENWINFFFSTSKWIGEPKIGEPHKHDSLQWFKVADFPQNLIEYVRKALQDSENKSVYDQLGWYLDETSSHAI